MSFRIAVMPEDPTNNGYILKPLIEVLASDCGKPNAQVEVINSPKGEGYEGAKRLLRDRVLRAYARRDAILFLPDSDLRDRSADFDDLIAHGRAVGARLLCCAAVPEVEAWLLAGHLDSLSTPWSAVRTHSRLKESVFEPFLAEHGDPRRAGGGRDVLMKMTLRNYTGLLQRCPELARLRDELREQIRCA